jgi:hypothetical protein
MTVNYEAPTTLTSLLIGDESTGSLSYTEVDGEKVSASLELQSVDAAFVVNRLTHAERDELEVVCDGMIIYNKTSGQFNFRENDSWHDVTSGSVVGPNITVDNSIPAWDGVTGVLLKGTGVIIGEDDAVTGLKSIALNSGFAVSNLNDITSLNSVSMTSGLDIDLNGNITEIKSLTMESGFGVDESGNITNVESLVTTFGTDLDSFGNLTGLLSLHINNGGEILNASGDAASPPYSFSLKTDVGMYYSGGDSLSFAALGARQFEVLAGGVATNYLIAQGSTAGVVPAFRVDGADAAIDLGLSAKGTGSVSLLGNGTTAGGAKFWSTNNTFYTQLKCAAPTANVTFSLPTTDSPSIVGPTSTGAPLTTDGAGTLSFDGGLPRYAMCTLTAAQINNLYDTPVLLITNPGGTQTIAIHSVRFQYLFGGIAFAGGGNVYLLYTNVGHGSSGIITQNTIITSAFFGATSNIGTVISLSGVTASTIVRGANVYITNATGAFTTGDGTMNLFITYSIYPT